MQTEEKLKKRITYEKMLAGISEQAVSVYDLDDFLGASLKSMGSILDVSRWTMYRRFQKYNISRPADNM